MDGAHTAKRAKRSIGCGIEMEVMFDGC